MTEMTREDIIAMAREAGLEDEVLVPWAYEINMFAALIAAAERERIKEANTPEIEKVNKELRRLHEVNQELLEALKDFLNRDEKNTCQHETTHRGGAIWEICDDCGSQWADDRGGKPKWKDPQEWVKARTAIAKAGEQP